MITKGVVGIYLLACVPSLVRFGHERVETRLRTSLEVSTCAPLYIPVDFRLVSSEIMIYKGLPADIHVQLAVNLQPVLWQHDIITHM